MSRAYLAFFMIAVMGVMGMFITGCSKAVSQTPSVTVTWTNPDKNTDQSVFTPATDQKGTMIAWGTTKGGPYPNQSEVLGAVQTAQVPYPGGSGKYYFVIQTEAKNGTISAPSAEALKDNPFAPSPPTNVSVK